MVNIKLDSKCTLVDVGIPLRDSKYAVKALEIDGISPALNFLSALGNDEEGKSIRQGLRIVSHYGPKDVSAAKCVSPDRKGREIYEIAKRGGGKARLFFFYHQAESIVIVCLDGFWKKGSNKKERKDQDRAFDNAARIREEYLAWLKKNPSSK